MVIRAARIMRLLAKRRRGQPPLSRTKSLSLALRFRQAM